jgi:hypothetical protein
MRPARFHIPSSARPRFSRKWSRSRCATVLVALTLGLGGSIFVAASTAAPRSGATSSRPAVPTPRCHEPAALDRPVDRLHVTANHLLDGDGRVFTPDGISVFGGLQDADWKQALASSAVQIKAAGRYWHANTVRIPVSEANLFHGDTPGRAYNASVLQALCREVRLARTEHMTVIITDQTEFPDWVERNPDARTIRFWDIVAREYADQPGIVFDPFNEPRQVYKTVVPRDKRDRNPDLKIDHRWVWQLWQRGGRAAGRTFVGMQRLVDKIRATGAQNVMEIEGPFYDDTLDFAGQYPINGSNLTWAIHHPPLNGARSWTHEFGYLARVRPVEINEWSQYASPRPECRANAFDSAPRFLSYAHARDMGVSGWSLQPGSLVAESDKALPTNITNPREPLDPRALASPSRLERDYACNEARIGEGVGQLLLDYFKRYSHR